LDTATDFLAEETPDVIYQLLLWHGVYNFLLFLVSIFFFTVCSRVIYWAVKGLCLYDKEPSESQEDNYFIGLIIAILILIISSIFLLNLEWLKIWIAPKVWLIEYAADLVK